MRALRQWIGICALIASLFCVIGFRDDGHTTWMGWPFAWGMARGAKTNPPAMLWSRFRPESTKPLLLIADVGVGLAIGATVGYLIGQSTKR